jgi:hypothetical protein
VLRHRRELGLLLLTALFFGAGFALGRLQTAPPRLGPRGAIRPAALEQAWRAHLAGDREGVRAALGQLDVRQAPAQVRDEATLLRALADGDVQTLERLAEGAAGEPASVVAAALRALARGAAAPERRVPWAQRFVRRFPRSWAAPALAAERPR